MSHALIVVPTPIGNLEDMTIRGLRVLGEVGHVAAEDTRHATVLLNHYQLRKRMVAYHQHNKRSAIPRILQLLEVEDVALVSDAGMPAIADPGWELIRAALRAGYRVEVLPGPSAVTTAVALAALPARGFVFLGYLPRRAAEARRRLAEVADLEYSLVFFEAPHRVLKTAQALLGALGNRDVVAVRELSKIHEEAIRTDLTDLARRLEESEARGEWTFVVGPSVHGTQMPDDQAIERALLRLLASGMTGRDAVAQTARDLHLARGHVYSIYLRMNRDERA